MPNDALHNILIIKLRYIGDVLLSTPVVRALRERYPRARISMLVNPGTEEILCRNPHLDELLVVPRGDWKSQWAFLCAIRARRFDCVIDLTDGDRAAVLAAVSGAPIRIGFNHEGRWRGRLYSHCVKASYGTMHMVEYHAHALVELGWAPVVGNPHVFLSDEHHRAAEHVLRETGLLGHRVVMLHPAARYWFKAWPAERFAQLSDRLIARGWRTVLVGAPHEVGVAQEIQRHVRRPIVSIVGRTRLLELAALMTRCALFVGNDAGPMHLAAAVGCPVVGLFGPTDPAVWGPRGAKTAVLYKGVDCRACFHPGCFRGEESCMKRISVDEVYAEALALLSA